MSRLGSSIVVIKKYNLPRLNKFAPRPMRTFKVLQFQRLSKSIIIYFICWPFTVSCCRFTFICCMIYRSVPWSAGRYIPVRMQMPRVCWRWLACGISFFVLIVRNPAFIARQLGHMNAEMTYTGYSAWINVLDSDQVPHLNQCFGGYANAPIVPLKLKTK